MTAFILLVLPLVTGVDTLTPPVTDRLEVPKSQTVVDTLTPPQQTPEVSTPAPTDYQACVLAVDRGEVVYLTVGPTPATGDDYSVASLPGIAPGRYVCKLDPDGVRRMRPATLGPQVCRGPNCPPLTPRHLPTR